MSATEAEFGYPNPKKVHRAGKINPKGEVSALCFPVPKAIDLKSEWWTIVPAMVTCPKCIKIMKGAK